MNILMLFLINIILMGLGFFALALLVFKAYKRLRKVIDLVCTNSSNASNKEIVTFDYSNLFLPHQAGRKNLLVYGSTLKFLQPFYFYFKKDFNLIIIEDKYFGSVANPALIKEKLAWADIIWVEWLTGQAVFMSNNLRAHQKLFVRIHRFEFFKDFGFNINTNTVNKIIVINPQMGYDICQKFGYKKELVEYIPNGIDTDMYNKPKTVDCFYNIALIGYHEKRKRLDLALDLLEKLLCKSKKYKLYLVGQHPANWFDWKIDKGYYEPLFAKINDNFKDSVVYVPFIDVSNFLPKIGYVISTSDHEGSHQSPTEGLASASLAFCLPWVGVQNMYLKDFIVKDIDEMAKKIDYYTNNLDEYKLLARKGQIFVQENYDVVNVYKKIKLLMLEDKK